MDPSNQTQDQSSGGGEDSLIPSKGLSQASQSAEAVPTGGTEGQVENNDQQVASGEILVDLGGATKRVAVDDLVKAYRSRGEIEQLQGSVDQKLSELGAARALQTAIQDWTPEQQQMLETAMHQIQQGRFGQPSSDDDDFDLRGGDDERPRQGVDPALQQRLDQMERTLGSFVQERHQQTLGQRIEAEMGSFPVFSEDEAAASFAKEAILNKFAANPRADLGEITAEVAASTHKMIQAAQNRVLPRGNARSDSFPTDIPTPERPPTGADLESGAVLKALRGALDRA